jgi:hypothetical protein
MFEDDVAVAERAAEWERFDQDLGQEAKNVLCEMVEAAGSVDGRRKFMLVKHSMGAELLHPGLPNDHSVVDEDLEILAHYGLLLTSFGSKGSSLYSITPIGKRYYDHLRSDEPQRVARIEEETKRYLATDGFGQRHPRAYACWKKADDLLWAADAKDRQSEIGHNCRDAVVAFATGLVERFQPEGVEEDPAKFLDRMRAVFESSSTSKDLGRALGAFWQYLAPLIMRQVHKERQQGGLTVEDGKRVVFLSLMAMVEADRLLR